MRVGEARGRLDLCEGHLAPGAELDVLGDGPADDQGFLRNEAHLGA